MSFEQDYIMRMIHEMIRMLIKLLFNIDMDRPTFQIIDEMDDNDILKRLIKMIDDGNINEAENRLYDIIEQSGFIACLHADEDILRKHHGADRRRDIILK